ncbi:MAG TPA: beta-ketoacyl-ACP synthase III [Brumimicrobium sp.]|nr:beta-ketoacyl-ACP synthase III [Brumimicrobium sp.]
MLYRTKIAGVGSFLPDNVVTNDDLSKIIDTNDEWIQERSGIKERRHILKGTYGDKPVAHMGVEAAKIALERASIDKDDIDLIVFATVSPDYYFPGSGVLVQEMMDIKTCPALDVRNQCSGFIYGLSVADQFIRTGMYKNILLIGSEYQSGGMDMSTRGRAVSVLFGDGAGAVVLTRSESDDKGILSTHLHSEGKHALELSIKTPSTNHWVPEIIEEGVADNPSYYPYMNGQLVFKNAVVRFSEVIMEGLAANNLTKDDIDMLIPHQANLRIADFVQRQFGLSDNQIFNNIQKYGNTTAASIPIAMNEAWEKGKIKDGDTVVLAAFGSGFTWASAVIKW